MTKHRIVLLGSLLNLFSLISPVFGQAPAAPAAPRREFKNDGMAQDCALSSDGHWLMVAENMQVNVFHTRTALAVRQFEGHKHSVTAVAANPRKRVALSADRYGQILMWNIDNLNLVLRYETPKDSVNLLRFATNGETFAAVTQRENALFLFDILTTKPLLKPRKFTSKVTDAHIDLLKNNITTAHWNGSIQMWRKSGDSLQLVKIFKAHESNITALRYFKNGNFVTASADNTLRFWKNNGDPLKTITLPEAPRSLDLSPDNKTVVIGYESGKTIIADSEKIKENEAFTATPSVLKVIFHPVEPLVVTLYSDNIVRSWKLK